MEAEKITMYITNDREYYDEVIEKLQNLGYSLGDSAKKENVKEYFNNLETIYVRIVKDSIEASLHLGDLLETNKDSLIINDYDKNSRFTAQLNIGDQTKHLVFDRYKKEFYTVEENKLKNPELVKDLKLKDIKRFEKENCLDFELTKV